MTDDRRHKRIRGLIFTLCLTPMLAGLCAPQTEVQVVRGQPSWVIRSDEMEMAVTKLGAHMAPVTFYRSDDRPVRPYYISPWQEENLDLAYCPVLVPLRGDFFCLPFGGNGTAYHGELHPPHGETAGSPWTLVVAERIGGVTSLTIALETKVRAGRVTRQLSLVDGQNVVYSRSVIEGFTGKTSFAHHAILAMPEKERVFRISTSPFKFGMTFPGLFSDPSNGEYQSFAMGEKFEDLRKVPLGFKDTGYADCTVFPARRGYADLLQMYTEPSKRGRLPAWITAVNTQQHWLWFALKDPAVMPGRVLWIENHGRHDAPWNGRNNCLGIEDGCSFFDKGLAESAAENVIMRLGVPTYVDIKGDQPFAVNYIEGVVKVPAGFEQVTAVRFQPGMAVFVAASGQHVSAPVQYEFLYGDRLLAAGASAGARTPADEKTDCRLRRAELLGVRCRGTALENVSKRRSAAALRIAGHSRVGNARPLPSPASPAHLFFTTSAESSVGCPDRTF